MAMTNGWEEKKISSKWAIDGATTWNRKNKNVIAADGSAVFVPNRKSANFQFFFLISRIEFSQNLFQKINYHFFEGNLQPQQIQKQIQKKSRKQFVYTSTRTQTVGGLNSNIIYGLFECKIGNPVIVPIDKCWKTLARSFSRQLQIHLKRPVFSPLKMVSEVLLCLRQFHSFEFIADSIEFILNFKSKSTNMQPIRCD